MSDSGVVTIVAARFDGLLGCGLAELLREARGLHVLASGLAGVELELAIERLRPRIAILDDEVEYGLLVSLRSRQPATAVVVLACSPTRLFGTSLLAVGATCLSGWGAPNDILVGVRRAARGEPTFVGVRGDVPGRCGSIAAGVLTRREAEVFLLLSRGQPYPEIARRMQIGYETVVTHTRRICKKAKVKNRLELIGMTLET